MPKCVDEGRGFIMAVWCGAFDPLALWTAAVARRHVGGRPGFVDKDELLGLQSTLPSEPGLAGGGDVLVRLLGSLMRLFLVSA